MKLDVSEIKKNTILEIDGQLFKVIDFAFMQCQQRQGSYTFKLKNFKIDRDIFDKAYHRISQGKYGLLCYGSQGQCHQRHPSSYGFLQDY